VNLSIEKDLVIQIKAYAEKHKTSVSDLVEEYFSKIVKTPKTASVIDRIERLPKPDIEANIDLKDAYYQEKAGKYGF
jgi:hypothetical protein